MDKAFIENCLLVEMHRAISNGKKGIMCLDHLFDQESFMKFTEGLCRRCYDDEGIYMWDLSGGKIIENYKQNLLYIDGQKLLYNFKVDWIVNKLNSLDEKIDNLFYVPNMPGAKQAEEEFNKSIQK